jgi:hypothetical protein
MMKTKQILLLIGVGIIAAFAGYALAYAIFSEWLVNWVAGSGSGEWERGVFQDIYVQACCAGPILLVLGAILATIAAGLLQRAVKISTLVRYAIVAALAFITGFVTYFPFQFLLIMSAAL